MSAENIARALEELASGSAINLRRDGEYAEKERFRITTGHVIDGTAFAKADHEASKAKGQVRQVRDFEDVRPPFRRTLVAFSLREWLGKESFASPEEDVSDMMYLTLTEESPHPPWTHCISLITVLFEERGISILGPTSQFFIRVEESGAISDDLGSASYLNDVDPSTEEFVDSEGRIFYATLALFNMANCANVEIVEPRRQRAERRRIERITNTKITNLMIRSKVRRYARGSVSQQDEGHMPLHSVRGHVAHYGDCCPGSHAPRGKLFGKYDRKIWVPGHARGSEEHGVRKHVYEAEPSS